MACALDFVNVLPGGLDYDLGQGLYVGGWKFDIG